MGVVETMFCLIRNEITGETLPKNIEYDVDRLIALSKRHDLAHLISDALICNGIVTEKNSDYKNIKKLKMVAIYRETQINETAKKVADIFQQNKIRYIPLKGSVVRGLYPEPWMRTSADIDVLIKREDFDKATELLFQNDFTTENERTSYDMGFYFGKTHLELHHSLCRNSDNINDILKDVWDNAAQKDGYEYAMEKEFFVFHHITHMLSHILDGGCGIRPFIDLWILRNKRYYDEEKLKPLLEKCGLVIYYEKICELSEVWMEGKPHNEVTESLQKYILKGGTYGSEENGHEIGVAANKQSRFKYIWNLAFPNYKFMCYVYPSVKKHKILLPLCYVHRFFSKLFGKERKRIRGRIKNINSSNEQNVEEVASLIKDLGLN